MKLYLLIAECAFVFAAVTSTTSHAAIVNVSFEAINFTGNLGSSTPQDPVSGSFSFEHDGAANFTGNALSLNPTLRSVNLTINSLAYDLGNTALNSGVLLNNGLVSFFQVGGSLNGFGTVSGNTNDFNLVLSDGGFGAPSRMRYTIEGASDIFLATNTDNDLTNVTFQSTVVPIPAAVWLFGSGLIGLAGTVRRWLQVERGL